jgi:hypothetical protein
MSETAQGQGQGNNSRLKPCNISSNIEKHNSLFTQLAKCEHFQLPALQASTATAGLSASGKKPNDNKTATKHKRMDN